MISSEDIAYIAGLFDGEGSIHFKRGIEKSKLLEEEFDKLLEENNNFRLVRNKGNIL